MTNPAPDPATPRWKVSVVLLTKDPDGRFARLLDAVRRQDAEAEVELVVVDSGSRQPLDELADRFGAALHHIPPEEFGHGRTRNQASRLTSGDVLVFLSQDAVPLGGRWLTHLLDPLRSDLRVGAVYGRQVPYPRTPPDEQAFYAYFYPNRPARLDLAGDATVPYVDTAFLSDVNAAVRRAVWEQIPFSDDVPWAEDKDFAFNALAAGHALCYQPAAAVYHSHGYTLRSLFTRRYRDGVAYSQVAARHARVLKGTGGALGNVAAAGRFLGSKTRFLIKSGQATHLPYTAVYDLVFFAAFGLGALRSRSDRAKSARGSAACARRSVSG